MSPTADRLQHVDAELEGFGIAEERLADVRARAHEAYDGDLGRLDQLLATLSEGVTLPEGRPDRAPAFAAAADAPSTMDLDIEELDEGDFELEEVVLEAEPAPSMPVPSRRAVSEPPPPPPEALSEPPPPPGTAPEAQPGQKGLTESVLFGVLEGGFDQVEEEVLAETAIEAEAEGGTAAEAPSDDLAAMLEAEGFDEGGLAALEGEESATAPEGEEGEEGEEGDEDKKGFFRKLFG